MAVINNDYQTNLLFKQFTGVAATQLDSQFSNEPYRAIKNIFSRDVFIEDIPAEAPITIYLLDNSGNWLDSSTGAPSTNGGGTFAALYPDSKLQFYKNIELTEVPGSQSRVWRYIDASGQNILQDTINFKYDDVNSSYLMRVKYKPSSVYINNPLNSYPLFWVLDNQSGYLQLYQSTAILGSATVNIPTNPPKISFFKYVGKKGITNLDVSGQQQVADLSGVIADISNIEIKLDNINRMVLPDGYVDISGAVTYDLCGNEVIRTNYDYVRQNIFIGYPTLPILDVSSVNHLGDPSHNGITYELDVSGSCWISGNLNVMGHTSLQDASVNNLDVSGNLNVMGHTSLTDVSVNNLDVSENLNVMGHTSLTDVSVNNLDVSGTLTMNGQLNLGCNVITDASRISFCNGAYIDSSGSGNIYIEAGGSSKFAYIEGVQAKAGVIYSLQKLTMGNGTVGNPSLTWANGNTTLTNHHTGFYQPGGNHGKAVGITCSGEEIASFHFDSSMGIQFFRDVSMNMNQINTISDATDSSGVPSWGQVQALVAGGSGSYWTQSGSDIYYNTGNVGIGTATPAAKLDIVGTLFVTEDICSNRLITYENSDLDAQSYIRYVSTLAAPRPPMSPLETNLVGSARYDASQYPSSADPVGAKLATGTTVLVPIAICPVSMQQYEAAIALTTTPNLGFNASAYFTIKLYDGTAMNSRFVHGTPNLGRAVPLQQIHFIAGLINKDNSEGGGAILYEKIPFIKVLSNINLGRGGTVGGPYSQLPYYIDGVELWEDKTDILASGTAVQPYVVANGTTYLILRLSANLALQSDAGIPPMPPGPTQSLFTDFNCFYDVRMYKDNTGLNDTISNSNPVTPSMQPNDWNLLTAYQQLWLLGNSNCTTHPTEWEEMLLNNFIAPAPYNYPLTQNSGSLVPGDLSRGNWFGNLYSVQHPATQFSLNHLTAADVSLNIWLEEPYGITNTKEVFLDEVRCYSTVDICGNTRVQNISCNNIDVNNSIDVGASLELTITENKITSTNTATSWAPNPGGTGSYDPGLEFEAENFYFDCGYGVTRGFIVSLGDNTSDTIFRIVDNDNNYSSGAGTPPLFQVEGSGYTQTQHISPFIDLSYNIGSKWGGGPSYLRYKTMYINDIEATGEISSNDIVASNSFTSIGNSYIYGDISMNGGKITFMGDATDNSGAASWGQVQTAIQDLSGIVSGNYWIKSGSDLYYNMGNIGIGTTTPNVALDISGDLIVSNIQHIDRIHFDAQTATDLSANLGLAATPNYQVGYYKDSSGNDIGLAQYNARFNKILYIGGVTTYEFCTPRYTNVSDNTDFWGFAARGMSIGPIYSPWPASGGGLYGGWRSPEFAFNVMSTDPTSGDIPWNGWFNNWHITISGGLPSDPSDNFWPHINRFSDGAEIDPLTEGNCTNPPTNNSTYNDYGIEFKGDASGNHEMTVYTSENFIPGNWQMAVCKDGRIGYNEGYFEDQQGVGQSYPAFGIGGIPAAPPSGYSQAGGSPGVYTSKRAATSNYYSAPQPNSSGYIVGLTINNFPGMYWWGGTSPGNTNPPAIGAGDDQVKMIFSVVKGEFTKDSTTYTGGPSNVGLCEDTVIADIITLTRQTLINYQTAGPKGDNVVATFNFDNALPFVNVSYFRLRTTIFIGAGTYPSTSGTPFQMVPDIQIPGDSWKVGAQLNILWNTEI